jgi:hypothetical protein
VAIYFEGEPGDTRTYTYAYAQLTEEVKKAANAFESLGVVKGDRVAVYLPMIPEAVITLSAGARIGAVPSVVFGGFSADALGPPDRGCRGQAGGHSRRDLPPRQAQRPETRCGRSPRQRVVGASDETTDSNQEIFGHFRI